MIAGGTFTAKLHAQMEPGLLFSVPFAFSTNGHSIPAGTYQVTLDSSQFLISIRNVETGEKQFFTVRPEQQRTIASQGLLVFHRCGERKELTEFHIPGADSYSMAIPSRRAKSAEAKSCPTTDAVFLAAR